MLKKIKEFHKTKRVFKLLTFLVQSTLLILLTLTVITFITSRSPILGTVRSMVVISGSMEPKLPVGSIVYIRKQLGYDKGSIVTYVTESGQNVTHRINGIVYSETGTKYITKGDANKDIDSESITEDKVTGKVFLTIPYLGRVTNFLNSPRGFLSLVIAPSILFIAFELWNIKKEIEKSVEKRVLARIKQQQTI